MSTPVSSGNSNGSYLDTPYLSQRILTVDSYMQQPNPKFDPVRNEFNQTENHWVPVIRIFGPSTKGQKCCAHIHGVFPYLYVPAPDGVSPEVCAALVDEALNRGVSTNGKSTNQLKHVVRITPVRGKAFYGYRNADEEFYKIYFYTPYACTKASQLLASGSVLGRSSQPHESHIPFILQFFMDYNLFGMNLIHFRKLLFRQPSADELISSELKVIVDGQSAPDDLIQDSANTRTSRCDLEFDVTADDIMNAYEKRSRSSNPGIAAIWQDEIERRRQKGLPLSQEIAASAERQLGNVVYETEKMYFQKLYKRLETAMLVPKYADSFIKRRQNLQESSQVQRFLPQPDEVLSQSENIDDERVIQFLQEMAREAQEEEEDELSQRSILKTNEEESMEPHPVVEDTIEEEKWAESFMSETLLELNESGSDEDILIQSESGAARTDPVFIRPKNIRDARREWNIEVLESFMLDIMNNKFQNIELDFDSDPANECDQMQSLNSCVPSKGADPDSTNLVKKITQAQKLFADAYLRKTTVVPENSKVNGLKEVENTKTEINDTKIVPEETDTKPLTKSCEPEPKEMKVTRPIQVADASSQSENPEKITASMQTEYPSNGRAIATNTEAPSYQEAEVQTDGSLADVRRTCDCRCNCGLQYMKDLRANWEVAQKSKDRSVQTEKSLSDDSPLAKRRKAESRSFSDGFVPPGGKYPKIMLDPGIVDKYMSTKTSESSSPGASTKKPNTSRAKHLSPRKSPHRKQGVTSPSIEVATKLLHKHALKALSRQRSNDDPNDKSVNGGITDEINISEVHSPNMDLSITSVYEYEATDSPEQRSVRLQATKKGLRLFQFKQQQMLRLQRESSRKRKKKKDMVEDVLAAQYPGCEIFKPFKRTPQESFIAELVAQDESRALPAVADYYAEKESASTQKKTITKPSVVKFRGGNLSDGEDDSDDTQTMSQSQNSYSSPAINNLKSPFSIIGASKESENSPRSILKNRQKEGISGRSTKPKRIRWGLASSEEKNNKSSNESVISKNSSSLYNPDHSEIDGPSMNPFNGNVNFENLKTAKAFHTHQYLTIMCMELFCKKNMTDLQEEEEQKLSDDFRLPDPEYDEIVAIFYEVREDKPGELVRKLVMLAVGEESENKVPLAKLSGYNELIFKFFATEVDMLKHFLDTILIYDPDILIGYEILKMSWGYLLERGHRVDVPVAAKISRLFPEKSKVGSNGERALWDEVIPGRIVLNLWKLLRHEIAVQSYTFESAMFHILQERVGLVTHATLNCFWTDELERFRTVKFFCQRVTGCMRIIDKLDLINRTSELARLFGIQFFEVFSRGSQFRVESMMLRLAKPENLIPPSPTVAQRARMRAPMELPLIMEPISKIYRDPVAVLDFQSLYPSIIIGYNYDFTTCLGRVEHLGKEDAFEFGCLDLHVDPAELKSLVDANKITISPTGVAFVKAEVKRGILPEMLQQILDTRIMVKKSMKENKADKTLYKVLDSRQLGLKLIANVTYGYTSANFSGRMPCVEIADSVVSKGRETLERAINLIQENKERWGAEVVYGDTDSMFVMFPNTDRPTAFKRAQEIADEVTAMNPKPIKLKLEKIYQPCILQTKKRYVGFSYETPNQEEPTYDAKGIETVRRDGCPAVAKILQKSLTLYFTSNDELKLRKYLDTQFQKIMLGNVSLSDYTFAREYRGRSGYKPGAVVPALAIAERLRNFDPRSEPQPRERVPYVVIYGTPGQNLIHQTRTPREFVEHEDLRINAVYYIERVIIPALNRCFLLAGIDVMKWYSEVPRRNMRMVSYQTRGQQGILEPFLLRQNCLGCDGKAENIVCQKCLTDFSVYLRLLNKADALSRKISEIPKTCDYCAIGTCVSLDCKTWQKLVRYDRVQLRELELIHQALEMYDAASL